jgi:UDP-N-acetylmuramoyl-L-alanyl-D-glutamate--2,6-diaminopimelate ligase
VFIKGIIDVMSSIKNTIRKIIPESVISDAEETYRYQKARAAYVRYGKSPDGQKVIAVTGTNGKTSTCTYINSILKVAGLKTAVYTTAYTEMNGVYAANTTHMTVASPWSVQKFFRQAKDAGVDWVILEVTSHALDQHRIYGVPVEIAIITNLSQDHLDYHKTMENYAAAKAKLITEFHPKHVILNADDEWYEYYRTKVENELHAVGRDADHQILHTKLTPSGSRFELITPLGVAEISMNQIGEFNVYNGAMAAVVGQILKLNSKTIADGIKSVDVIEGRLEPVDAGQDFAVLVDYAHTPDAIKNVVLAAKGTAEGRVRLVFGATGVGEYARDTTKRGPMGEIAVETADFIYLTDDETYLEDGDKIRDEVEKGILKAGGKDKYVEIGDRYEAIKQACKDAKTGDVVLLCGIGHQDYRNMGGEHQKWDERLVAKEILEQLSR